MSKNNSPAPKHINDLVAKKIRDADAYRAPDASPDAIKLDAMENPYSPPSELHAVWLARLGEVQINRYPDSQCRALKQHIRAAFAVDDAHGLLLGNGSDEIIQMLAATVGGTLLAPTPTFSMYSLIATVTGAEFVGVPLRDDFSLDGDAMLDAIRRRQPRCIFLAMPNNPTGNCFDESVMLEIVKHATGIVVVDEAYFAFCRRSFLPHLTTFPDLMILRTLSKSGLAGLRLGMLIAHPDWIAQLEKVRLPYNINSLTQCSASFYLEHNDVMNRQASQIIEQREMLLQSLAAQAGVTPYPSDANFILMRTEKNADEVDAQLRSDGVLIKNLNHTDPTLKNCLRITVGSESENQKLLSALKSACGR